ncbi:MAG: hypothetical protein NUW00_04765 [Candidatus Kaiserbacteria bacterium]|nr:hypothetical protein [Candidatus Kaiserbacteria bacterium]
MFPTFRVFTERHPRYVTLVGFSIFVLGMTLYGFQQISERTVVKVPPIVNNENTEELQKSLLEPMRTDFGASVPDGFVADIPVEGGVMFEQSYSLEYPEQKQLSVVFPSALNVKENYILYEDFLKDQGWNVLNRYESDMVSSLYATKENEEVNVTIGELGAGMAKSQVSISILKK